MAYVPWEGFGPYESYDADETLAGGEVLNLAGLELDVIFTPGHSPGHVTYSVRGEDAIFSGDVLFQGSVGRVDLPGGDWPTLADSIARLKRPQKSSSQPMSNPALYCQKLLGRGLPSAEREERCTYRASPLTTWTCG